MKLLPTKYARANRRLNWRIYQHVRQSHSHAYRKRDRVEIPARLTRRGWSEMDAFNARARSHWFRLIAGELCRRVGAGAPDFVPSSKLCFVTLADAACCDHHFVDPEDIRYIVERVRRRYAQALRGLDYIGMIDAALYVSARRALGATKVICFHVHVVAWGCKPGSVRKRCERLNNRLTPPLFEAKVAQCKGIRDGDLLKVLSYAMKTPFQQYQAWRPRDGSGWRQRKRQLNGTNARYLFEQLDGIDLPKLTIAGGEGIEIKEAVTRFIRSPLR